MVRSTEGMRPDHVGSVTLWLIAADDLPIGRASGARLHLPTPHSGDAPMKIMKSILALGCMLAFAGTAAAADVSYVLETPGVT